MFQQLPWYSLPSWQPAGLWSVCLLFIFVYCNEMEPTEALHRVYLGRSAPVAVHTCPIVPFGLVLFSPASRAWTAECLLWLPAQQYLSLALVLPCVVSIGSTQLIGWRVYFITNCLLARKWTQADVIFVFKYSSCVGVEEEEAPDIDIYHCPNCEKTHGKSTRKYTCLDRY